MLLFILNLTCYAQINQKVFDQTTTEFLNRLIVPINNQYKLNIDLKTKWESDYINATMIQTDNQNTIMAFGGFARQAGVTPEVFSLLLCHELGHIMGGFPLKRILHASVEGQADLYATLMCLKILWLEKKNIQLHGEFIKLLPHSLYLACMNSFQSAQEQIICLKSIETSLKFVKIASNLIYDKDPLLSLNRRSLSRAYQTLEHHPPLQCRLDTLVLGSITSIPLSFEVLSEDYFSITRPSCWYYN